MATQNTCFFNKYGFCKYLDKCRRYHENKKCEKLDCEIRDCPLRHPKVCRFFRDFRFCKFGEWCKFSHEVLRNASSSNEEIERLQNKLMAVENDLKKNSEKVLKLENEIKDIKHKLSEKEQTEVEKENRDEKHSECETSVIETKTNDLASDIQVKASETIEQISCEKSNDEKVFECEICTYKTKSESGIKIHKAKKHTDTCRYCNRTFTDKVEYSNHITECYSTYRFYDSPMSPHRIPPRFPPRFPHGSPPRFPPTYPPRFPRSPMY